MLREPIPLGRPKRRLICACVAVAMASSWGFGSASADSTLRAKFGAPEDLCVITDTLLPEISGAADTPDGLVVANDKGAVLVKIDKACNVISSRPLAGVTAIDVEDIAQGSDGTTWLIDSGGNRVPRRDVSLYGLRRGGSVVTAKFSYPSGTHDVEAAVVTLNSELVLFTKERGRSQIFKARLPAPKDTSTQPLVRVADLDVAEFGERPGAEGSLLITGAALSPDGLHVALRTYTDVFEWTVARGDVASSISTSSPLRVAKLSQRQGEAITYTANGRAIQAFSEQLPSPVLQVSITRRHTAVNRSPETTPRWTPVALGVPIVLAGLGLATALMRRWRRRSDVD